MRNATPLFAIHHKGHSLSSEPTLKLVRSDGQQLGTANFHTFSTRIDLALGGNHGAAPPLLSYKPTQPLPPACTPPGQTWRWEVAAMGPKRAVARLIATPDSAGKRSSRWTGRKSKGKAPLGEVVAVVWLEDKLKSGRVEVHQPGLPQSLFELVVLSAVAQMAEMRRNVKEGKKQLSAEALGALGESVGNWGDASGGSGGDGGGGGGGDGGGGGGAV
ncbi:uncharacterized protein HMPREF1541_03901 [Cyphellophora europaea CBS 101466]|uniref:Uncharacterized protein n=1 Tax=Cyphellophora europaea (strain CBS 101466) TaxID=1220924 RepID=W2RZV9_CYPE1|nr:uncharacterized protein HMPREF1541_03901 [Cyphellophora europaea CBS 101466]ETN41962.1 hypothetical protein HMPREF1541_03901 [Cyphellophora europaea CBS 101466]